MRIMHVVAGGATGGAETFSRDAILALAELGVEQRVVCRPHPIACAHYAAAGIPIVPMTFSRLERLAGGAARVRRQAEEFHPDLVHAWMGRAASFIPRRMSSPVTGWFGGYYDLRFFRTVDFCIAITTDLVNYLAKNGIAADRIHEVHTFGTLPDPDAPAADRAQFGTPRDAPLVLVLSRMHQKKGIETLLAAIALCPGVHAWLAGDGPEQQTYQTLCAKLGLDDRVRFLGWRTDRSALYKAADIIALPSRYEPFGTVIPEAWGMSRPLVSTRTLGASQYVTDGVDGLLCPIDDAPALASCIQRLVHDPALGRSLCENGRRVYTDSFSKPAVMRTLVKTYETMIGAAR
jgi:glycosyltransferase involved in cell wall biosynthesis